MDTKLFFKLLEINKSELLDIQNNAGFEDLGLTEKMSIEQIADRITNYVLTPRFGATLLPNLIEMLEIEWT